jgi:hypothetical protein
MSPLVGASLKRKEDRRLLTVKDEPELGAEVPRADQIPPIDLVHVAFPSAVNELGIKGVGERGVIAPGAVVANAVEDALADYGVRIDRLPVTPRRVFEALRAASADFPRLVR